MKEVKKILLPIDFSEVAPVIAKYAKDLAKTLGAKIILAYVLEDLAAYKGVCVDVKNLTELENTLLEGARKSMEDFLKNHFADFPEVEPVIEKGDVVETLISIAKEKEVDLIVIGTHGRKGLDRILFGSVAEGVVKNSPIPVLTINPYRAGLLPQEKPE